MERFANIANEGGKGSKGWGETGANKNYHASQAFHSTLNFIFLSSRAIVTVLSTVD